MLCFIRLVDTAPIHQSVSKPVEQTGNEQNSPRAARRPRKKALIRKKAFFYFSFRYNRSKERRRSYLLGLQFLRGDGGPGPPWSPEQQERPEVPRRGAGGASGAAGQRDVLIIHNTRADPSSLGGQDRVQIHTRYQLQRPFLSSLFLCAEIKIRWKVSARQGGRRACRAAGIEQHARVGVRTPRPANGSQPYAVAGPEIA